MKWIPVCLLAVGALGCVRMEPINSALYDKYLTRSYHYPRERCFAATVRALKDINTPVEKADEAAGVIRSDKSPILERVVAQGGPYSAVATAHTASHRLTLRVDGEGSTCTVRTTRYELWDDNQKVEQVNTMWTDERVWKPFFVALQDALDAP